jgi:phenylalanyl-tRNA synthetase beta chain
VTVPTFRPDIEREVDLIEEVARLYGFEKIPLREQGGGRLYDVPDHDADLEEAVHRLMVQSGCNEIVTNSLGAAKDYRQFSPDTTPVAVTNPLSEDLACLRPSLLADLTATAAHNFNHRNLDLRLYTVGLVFLPVGGGPAPDEELRLGLAKAGRCRPRFWGEGERAADWFDLKGGILDLFEQLRLPEPEFVPTKSPGLAPDAGFVVRASGTEIGRAGKLGPQPARHWDIDEALWLAELSLPAMQKLRGDAPEFHALPRYPGVMRDLALVVSEETAAGEVMTTIRQTGGELLVDLELFDLYRGKPLAPGTKSLAFSLVFRSPERSLQAAEVDAVMAHLVTAAGERHEATLRA